MRATVLDREKGTILSYYRHLITGVFAHPAFEWWTLWHIRIYGKRRNTKHTQIVSMSYFALL